MINEHLEHFAKYEEVLADDLEAWAGNLYFDVIPWPRTKVVTLRLPLFSSSRRVRCAMPTLFSAFSVRGKWWMFMCTQGRRSLGAAFRALGGGWWGGRWAGRWRALGWGSLFTGYRLASHDKNERLPTPSGSNADEPKEGSSTRGCSAAVQETRGLGRTAPRPEMTRSC